MPRSKKSKSQKRREKVQQEAAEEKKVVTGKEEEEDESEEETEEVDTERKDMDEATEAETAVEEEEDEDDTEPVTPEDKKPVEEMKTKKKGTQADETSQQIASLSDMMSGLVTGMTAIARRVERMETGGANEFRYHQKPEDLAKAAEGRVGVDERIVKIVDTILSEDFGVALERIDDNSLGLLFTLNVPQRVSDIKEDMRPVIDPVTRQAKKDAQGNDLYEKYWPGDHRSRAIPTGSSFDLIREHCERVRAYIVATYQKTNRPTPEFRIRQ